MCKSCAQNRKLMAITSGWSQICNFKALNFTCLLSAFFPASLAELLVLSFFNIFALGIEELNCSKETSSTLVFSDLGFMVLGCKVRELEILILFFSNIHVTSSLV